MENNKNKKFVKFQGDSLNFYDFILVFVFTRNHHLKESNCIVICEIRLFELFFPQYYKSDMSKYEYLEVF